MRTASRLLLPAALLVLCAVCLTLPARSASKGKSEGNKSFVPAKATISNHIVFRAGGETAAVYRSGGDLAKPILWPLLAPNNKEITRAWPMHPVASGGLKEDHPHQKSAWFTYGDVIPEGLELKHKSKGVEGIDFWSEGPNCGRIVCKDVYGLTIADNYVGVHTHNEWRSTDGATILDEERSLRFYNYEKARLIIVEIFLNARYMPITFGDTKEGAFGVRVADSMREDRGKGRITNAEGRVGEKQCWGRISAWCDYSGPVDGETVGIAIFADPGNRLPTCWHCRAYGLMAANPFGRAKSGFPDMKDKKDKKDRVHLAKDDSLLLNYGIFVHLGDAKEGKVAEAYELFKKMK
ncbi:MAG TPA: PmoA family protein [Gemmataceae bacterium]|nr:PmoA family protein [Gemmataceae bacterium]